MSTYLFQSFEFSQEPPIPGPQAVPRPVKVDVAVDDAGIVARLPKTADGIPITPGMLVHIIRGPHVDQREVVAPYGKLALLVRCYPEAGTSHHLAKDVYVSREAALVESAKFGRG